MTEKMSPALEKRIRARSLIEDHLVLTFSQTEPFLCSLVDTQSGLGRTQYSLTIPFMSSVKHNVTSRDNPKCGSATKK